jgi:hypothetical protein
MTSLRDVVLRTTFPPIKRCYRLVKLHEAPHIADQLYGVPHEILRVFFNTIFYENEFQNPQIFLPSVQLYV